MPRQQSGINMQHKDSKFHSSTTSTQISKSKSGFSDSMFVLVLKTADGRYSHPKKIPREDAIEIARDFEANPELAEKYGLTSNVADFIRVNAIRRGLIDLSGSVDQPPSAVTKPKSADVSSSSDSPRETEHLSSGGSGRSLLSEYLKPKYFPEIDAYFQPIPADETIEVIAFILSGVDPAMQREFRSNLLLNLRHFLHSATARVSPGLLMQDDHWYVLTHLHHLDRSSFKLAWEEGQSLATGQANTDVVKLVSLLDRFQITENASSLKDNTNKNFFVAVQEKSIELLSRSFRRIRRKIESVHEQPFEAPPRNNWLNAMFKRGAKERIAQSPVQAEVLVLAREYLLQAIKIGRILRSEVLMQQRNP